MALIFFIILVLACVTLWLIVLIQNPKGGGLSGSIGGFSNQLMGVKQTTDVLEKGTWIFASIIGILCIVSTSFLKGGPTNTINKSDLPTITNQAMPNSPATAPGTTTLPATTPKK